MNLWLNESTVKKENCRVHKFTINKNANIKQTMYETIINCIFVFMKKIVIPVNTAFEGQVIEALISVGVHLKERKRKTRKTPKNRFFLAKKPIHKENLKNVYHKKCRCHKKCHKISFLI